MPISIRLDDDVREELDRQARAHGVGLATLLRELATRAAREGRRARIRAASAHVGSHIAGEGEGGAFYAEWGTPRADRGQ